MSNATKNAKHVDPKVQEQLDKLKASAGTTPAATAPEVKPAKEKAPRAVFFTTEQEAIDHAKAAVKPARVAIKLVFDGKPIFCSAFNNYSAALAYCEEHGTVEQIGKAPRAPREVSAESLLGQVNGITDEAKRVQVMDQLKKLMASMAAAPAAAK